MWQGTIVALKKLKSPEAMNEFVREASILSTLNHPYVVHFYGIGVVDGEQYMVCEYMIDGALNHFLMKNKASLTIPHLIDIATQIAIGMQYLTEGR